MNRNLSTVRSVYYCLFETFHCIIFFSRMQGFANVQNKYILAFFLKDFFIFANKYAYSKVSRYSQIYTKCYASCNAIFLSQMTCFSLTNILWFPTEFSHLGNSRFPRSDHVWDTECRHSTLPSFTQSMSSSVGPQFWT